MAPSSIMLGSYKKHFWLGIVGRHLGSHHQEGGYSRKQNQVTAGMQLKGYSLSVLGTYR